MNLSDNIPKVYLSRRNIEALKSKLDRKKAGDETHCMIIKNDNVHPVYPQTMPTIAVVAVEDEDYYIDRSAGEVHPKDVK